MNFSKLPTLTFWRAVLMVILAAGFYSTVLRFTRGLGASTNLSDQFPWGLWIGFDVLCGVGLAAGGFTLAAIVYIFHIGRFHAVLRPSILTAFLGYALVAAALLFDLGKPYNIWHPLVMWNPHSVMFEVAWCVMLYLTVLALEFSPVVFERFHLHTPLRIVSAATIPLGLLIPLPMLLSRKIREDRDGLFGAAVLVIAGFLLNRLNVSITGLEDYSGAHYFPRWTEVAVTLSIVGVGFFLFSLAVRYLHVFETGPGHVVPDTKHGTRGEHYGLTSRFPRIV